MVTLSWAYACWWDLHWEETLYTPPTPMSIASGTMTSPERCDPSALLSRYSQRVQPGPNFDTDLQGHATRIPPWVLLIARPKITVRDGDAPRCQNLGALTARNFHSGLRLKDSTPSVPLHNR